MAVSSSSDRALNSQVSTVRLATTSRLYLLGKMVAAVWKLEWRFWHELWEERILQFNGYKTASAGGLDCMRSKHAGFITQGARKTEPNN